MASRARTLRFELPPPTERCIDISLQAPTGSNAQGWRVVVVTDPAKRRVIADAYNEGFKLYQALGLAPQYEAGNVRGEQRERILSSSTFDLRIGAAGGVVVHARGPRARPRLGVDDDPSLHEKQVAEALGIPEAITQAVLLPVAYYKGDDFEPAKRLPARELTYWDTWGSHRR